MSPTHERTNGGICTDTGKIMMGTALLLIMVSLIVHPANAAEPGSIHLNGQGYAPVSTSPVPDACDTFWVTGICLMCHDTHDCVRITR